MLLLAEGQTGEPGNLPESNFFFRLSGSIGWKCTSTENVCRPGHCRDCRLPLMATARVGARASPYGLCGGRMVTGTDVCAGTSVADCRYQATVLRDHLQLRSRCQQNA